MIYQWYFSVFTIHIHFDTIYKTTGWDAAPKCNTASTVFYRCLESGELLLKIYKKATLPGSKY